MKKFFVTARNFSIDNSIRNQVDVICTLIKVTQYLSSFPYSNISCNPDKAQIIIWVDKMSRLFLNQDQKIHCLNYPFDIRDQGRVLQFFFLKKKLDGISMNVILSILSNFDSIQKSIDKMVDCFFETMNDFSVELNSDMQFYWNLLIHLLTMETGYLRYDHDEFNNAPLHPMDHIDFFYSNSNTFKIGLKNTLTWQDVKEIIDIKSACHYLLRDI